MGRILRKKPTGLKKKKRHEDEAPDTAPASENGAAISKSASAAGAAPAAEADRKPALVPKKPQAVSAPAAAPPADNVYTRAVQFLREVKIELKKVTWPTRKQTLGSTAVVIVLVMIISLFLGLVDLSLGNLVRAVFK